MCTRLPTMSEPPAFQPYADSVVNGTYNDLPKLWTRVLKVDAHLAASFRKATVKGKLVESLRAALLAVHRGMRKAATNPNRGHRDGHTLPRPGAGKRVAATTSFAEMTVAAVDDYFRDNNGDTITIFDFEELTTISAGLTKASAYKGSKYLAECLAM